MTDAASAIMGDWYKEAARQAKWYDCGCEEQGLGYACNNDSNFCKLKIKQGKKQMHEMTREEAEQALSKLGVPKDMSGKYHILEVLETLNIIAFKKQEHTPESVLQKSINRQSAFEVNPRTLIAALKMKGYEIVKREAF